MGDKIPVLYISYDGMTDPLGQSQVIPYLEGLAERGFLFTLISFEKPERYTRLGKQISVQLQKSNIQWVPLTYHKSPPVLSTLYDLWKLKKLAKQLYKEHKYQIVHCRSYIASLTGVYLKQKYGLKFIFDMRGFWADERVEGGMWNLKNPAFKLIYSYFKKKERQFLQQADYTIILTENAKQFIESQKIKGISPVQVIPCCADLELFNPERIEERQIADLRKELGIKEDEFILLYLGSLGTWYKLDEMIRFYKSLLTYKPTAKFLIITKENQDNLLNEIQQMGVSADKVLIRSAERQEVPLYISLAHCGIFFYKTTFSRKATSPTKQGEIMGMGIPVICNKGVGDTADIIQNTASGVVIADFTEQNYAAVCATIDKLLAIDKKDIRTAAESYYALEKGINAYGQVYDVLLS